MSGAPVVVLAPTPLKSLAMRLKEVSPQHCAWRAYLPQQLQQQPEPLSNNAASAEDVDGLLPPESSSSIAGQVWKLSQDPQGCRLVQQALEKASSEEERCALATELRDHVVEALRCPHANHVLQKCINTMQPDSLQFIIDALMQQKDLAVHVAKHRYGCRVIQHLLKACPPSQTSELARSFMDQASVLCCHSFGNYVMQHVMKFCAKEHQYSLIRCIERDIASIARSEFGGVVIQTVLAYAAQEDKVWIARSIAQRPEVMLTLSKARLGYASALLVLETLPARDQQRLLVELAEHSKELRASRYGSRVIQRLMGEPCPSTAEGLQ